jgi:hypothetical protein
LTKRETLDRRDDNRTEQNNPGGLSPLLQTTRLDEQPWNADKNKLVIDTQYRLEKMKNKKKKLKKEEKRNNS